jgi:hypothetical protein
MEQRRKILFDLATSTLFMECHVCRDSKDARVGLGPP